METEVVRMVKCVDSVKTTVALMNNGTVLIRYPFGYSWKILGHTNNTITAEQFTNHYNRLGYSVE